MAEPAFESRVVDWCATCRKDLEKSAQLLCSRCKTCFYCSKECQVQDWPQHKRVCRTLQARAQHVEEQSLKRPETTYMLRDLDTATPHYLHYVTSVAFRSAFRLGRTPDRTASHYLRVDFLYDPEPADIPKRFKFLEARSVSFVEALAKTTDPRARSELQHALDTARARDQVPRPEHQKSYVFGALQLMARHVRTHQSRGIMRSNFCIDASDEDLPFHEVPTNENWAATLKQALTGPPLSNQQLTILDWSESFGVEKTNVIVRGLAIEQQRMLAANPSMPIPTATPNTFYRDRVLY